MRLPRFLPDRDRYPLRSVLIYATDGLAQRLKTWTFWLQVAVMPLLFCFLGAIHMATSDSTDLAVVAADSLHPQLERAAERINLGIELVTSASEAPDLPVLYVEGTDISALVLRMDDETSYDAIDDAESLIRRVRSAAVFSSISEEELQSLAALRPDWNASFNATNDMYRPLATAVVIFLGLVTGFGLAGNLAMFRDQDPFYGTLRLCTPGKVMFLGGTLQNVLAALMVWIPSCGILFGLFGLYAISVGAPSGCVLRFLLIEPALITLVGTGTVLFATGVGSVNARHSHGWIFTLFMGMMAAGPTLFSLGAQLVSKAPLVALFVPILGYVPATATLHPAWLAAGFAVQLVWTVLALAVGARAYGGRQ